MSDGIAVRTRHPQIPSHLDLRPVSRARGEIAASSRYVLEAVVRGSRVHLEKMTNALLLEYLKGYCQPKTLICRKILERIGLTKIPLARPQR
jgi:hypothetical protein